MVRTRFAPSPTGFLHIGGLRTALYSFAFAKSQGGEFILRIEDTDLKRYVPGATEKIFQVLKIFGLNWDEGPEIGGPYSPYIQSERVKLGIYQKYAQQLLDQGNAYYCFCPPQNTKEIEDRHQKKMIELRDPCRDLSKKEIKEKLRSGLKPAIRLRVPAGKKISYFDFVLKKEVTWETDNVDEVTLLKSDGFPTYHLGVVIDDYLMKISHIIRGRDWLPSTPVHLLLFKYLNFPLPQIGHLTDILDPEGGKLSKRKGTVACEEFLAQGYLPEAILNFIMLLGWAPKDNREIFSLEEFVKAFPKGNLHVSNPVFNRKKLDWFNGWYIRQKTDQQLFDLLKPFKPKGMSDELLEKTIPLVKERIVKLSDYPSLVDFLVSSPKIDRQLLIQKGGGDEKLIKYQISNIKNKISEIKDWKAEILEKTLRDLAMKNNWHVGRFFMTLRIVITGRTVTPPLFESMELLGKDESLKRLDNVLK